MYANLKKLRESLGLTQKDFGASVGISKTTYSNYELGLREPNSDFWISIADKYDVTVDYLVGRVEDPHSFFLRISDERAELSAFERQHIKKYRALDERGKEIVDLHLNSSHFTKPLLSVNCSRFLLKSHVYLK